jgi:RNA polymerase sigma factor (TIGR02999 family)
MTDVTRILSAIEEGDAQAAEWLLPLVYEELRKLATAKMVQEKPGQTLQATALVHEAYVRLVDGDKAQHWDSRGHFFSAAAEAMRRILVENARAKQSDKRGGAHVRRNIDVAEISGPEGADAILALNEALEKLAMADSQMAELVKLRYFGGLTNRAAAESLGISARTATSYWAYAKAWLLHEIEDAA